MKTKNLYNPKGFLTHAGLNIQAHMKHVRSFLVEKARLEHINVHHLAALLLAFSHETVAEIVTERAIGDVPDCVVNEKSTFNKEPNK